MKKPISRDVYLRLIEAEKKVLETLGRLPKKTAKLYEPQFFMLQKMIKDNPQWSGVL